MNDLRLLAAAVVGFWGFAADAAPARMEFADKIRMVSCDPASSVPCFRLKLNFLDAQGAPFSPGLPEAGQLTQSITVRVGAQKITPFYASASSSHGKGRQVRPRVSMLLVDVSGSMNEVLPTKQSRFTATKAAAAEFLTGFEDGADRVAIVPFGSRKVAPTIRAAKFVSSAAEAHRQITELPLPVASSNTALYSAVDFGLDVLAEEAKRAGGSPEVIFLVMTDGKNDIRPGDDPGLLEGQLGLDIVANKVKSSGQELIAIGFGDAKSIDEPALARLGTKHYVVQDPELLKRLFSFTRVVLTDRLHATFQSPWPDRNSLAARTLPVSVSIRLAGGDSLVSNESIWSTPQIGLPVYEGKCETAELKASLGAVRDAGGLRVARPILVFVGLGILLLVLWFWVPRLVWAELYVPAAPLLVASQPQAGAPGRPAPPGFETHVGGTHAAERAPTEPTTVWRQEDVKPRTRRLDIKRPEGGRKGAV